MVQRMILARDEAVVSEAWPIQTPRINRRREIVPPQVSSIHDTSYDLNIGNLVIRLVATLEKIELDAMTGNSRGTADICLARQVAMYLMHTVFSCPYHRVAAFFGRDRTTISYACRLIEDARDDIEFDRRLEVMENLLVSAKGLLELSSRQEIGNE